MKEPIAISALMLVVSVSSVFARDTDPNQMQLWQTAQSFADKIQSCDAEGALAMIDDGFMMLPQDSDHLTCKDDMAQWLNTLKPGQFKTSERLQDIRLFENVGIIFKTAESLQGDLLAVMDTWIRQNGKWLLIGSMKRTMDRPVEILRVYELVRVDDTNIPGMISHGGQDIMLNSGTFTIYTDKTCDSNTAFSLPAGPEISRQVRATYTVDDETMIIKWIGAGITKGTIQGDTFIMINEGMVFEYKKQHDTPSEQNADGHTEKSTNTP